MEETSSPPHEEVAEPDSSDEEADDVAVAVDEDNDGDVEMMVEEDDSASGHAEPVVQQNDETTEARDDAMEDEDDEEEEAAAVEAVEGDDEDDEEVLAAVVVDEHNGGVQEEEPDVEEVEAAVIVEATAATTTTTTPKQKRAKKATPGKSAGSGTGSARKKAAAASSKETTTSSGTKKKKKKRKQGPRGSSASGGGATNNCGVPGLDTSGIPPQVLEVASDARNMLQETVPTLPIPVGDTMVRSFGRLYLEPDSVKVTKFSTPSALYPVGFSCDRYEFSPVHGRVLKMRCSILDGRKIKQKQKAAGHAVSLHIPDGPIFRVLWGRGVDEDGVGGGGMNGSGGDGGDVDYPFDPFTDAAPTVAGKGHRGGSGSNNADTSSSPHASSSNSSVLPAVGMRVRVRFSKDRYFCGTITSATAKDTKKKRKNSKVTIQYDDGATETVVYPDPDVSLMMPGAEEEIDAHGNVELTELNGKPITSAVGSTPLEAWGQVLTKLGLIDEIMLSSAMDAVKNSRQEALKEARDKLTGKQPQPGKQHAGSGAPSPVPSARNSDDGSVQNAEAAEQQEDDDKEPPSEKEIQLKEQVEALMSELDSAQEGDRQASIALANSRINALGRFLCNPFHDEASGKPQQASWLATAVRKEKTRMGSTGNKKKIVTATDMLERNDTMFNADIEALIEGLPGSEFCKSYVFQGFRIGGSTALNRAWLHEQQLKQEKEAIKRQKRSREAQEKEAAKEQEQQEKENKRRIKEEFRDARKRQKLEEEEEKKKVRVEERLSRLRLQVEDRLFKEASAQREKVIVTLARNLGKEFSRRRRSAELIAGQTILETKTPDIAAVSSPCDLPSISKPYDEDTVRVWNFVTTFKSFFLERAYMTEIPSLDSLQASIDCLKGQAKPDSTISRDEAVSSLTDLSVALCKPLAASLTRVLFASLIALNPLLQKDFGAAFFNEVNANKSNDDEDGSRPDLMLPVNSMTWQEIARLTFLADALGELGYSRHEAAHILRGYRSAGHPNSKEARRLRRAEDFPVVLLRQTISESRRPRERARTEVVRAETPCEPLFFPDDFRFYLHNLHSAPEATPSIFKKNLFQAVKLLKESSSKEPRHEGYRKELEGLRGLLESAGSSDHPSKAESKALKKIKNCASKILNAVGGIESDKFAEAAANGRNTTTWPWKEPKRRTDEVGRGQMGLLNTLTMTAAEYKSSSHARENYMEEALRLKEELERQKRKDDEEDDDEDDDDDDDEEDAVSKAEVVVENGTTSTDVESSKPSGDGPKSDPKKQPAQPSAADETGPKPSASSSPLPPPAGPQKIGKETPYDEFCEDIPTAPELIRRCLAVLRTICGTQSAEPFIYPVDPQTNPAYYDSLLRPMCLQEVGSQLQKAVSGGRKPPMEEIEALVAQFGRNVRLIGQNCLSYANAGPTVISAGSELLRIFERLLLDWVLAPRHLLPTLEDLDDDRCVHHHQSDADSTVLLCDGCEGKYNIARLDPPLHDIPKGEWYCPRCLTGRWWGDLDPRLGKTLKEVVEIGDGFEGRGPEASVKKCMLRYPESSDSKPSIMYRVEFGDGKAETWSLEKVDRALEVIGTPVPRIQCLEAVAESVGYSFGVDHGLRQDLVPVPANPNVSDTAGQVALSSSVFRDTIAASGTLLVIDPRDMTASEWLRLLVLLAMKCASSDVFQSLISKMESEAAERMAGPVEKLGKISNIIDVLPAIDDDDGPTDDGVENVEMMDVDNGTKVETEPRTTTADVVVSSKATAVPAAAVVEASAVEIVDETDVLVEAEKTVSSAEVTAKPENELKPPGKPKPFAAALVEKKRRQKLIEDGFSAYCIKNHIRSTVASFEEDAVSQVVDSTMSSKDSSSLKFANLRCRRMVCSFCGLTDVALGLPLVRVPNEDEWRELMPHAARSRRIHLVAEMPSDPLSAGSPKSLVSVKIRVGDDIFSSPFEAGDSIIDGGMLEFAPRAITGFQDELRFRDEVGLPFVTGSLSAHECCAISAHKSRKNKMVQRYKAREADYLEKEFGAECGRTLEIGRDRAGRSFWRYFANPNALFVCSESSDDISPKWHCFPDLESIASVMVTLTMAKDDVVKGLHRAYPNAHKLVVDGTWSDALLKRKFPKIASIMAGDSGDDSANGEEEPTLSVEGGLDAYHVGEEVLVESKSGRLIWDATVTAQSKRPSSNDSSDLVIDAYRVEYTEWGSRFVEWVKPNRVIEPNENNRLLQGELFDDLAASRYGLPIELNMLEATNFLFARDRARGKDPIPDFASLSYVNLDRSSDAKTIGLVKAALFAIEAALPTGCIDTRDSGPWRKSFSEQWKIMVKNADGPELLVRLIIILEDTICPDWIKEPQMHLRSCLPAKWKAVGDASPSALALRVILFDRSIMYETVDRRKYSSRKRKR